MSEKCSKCEEPIPSGAPKCPACGEPAGAAAEKEEAFAPERKGGFPAWIFLAAAVVLAVVIAAAVIIPKEMKRSALAGWITSAKPAIVKANIDMTEEFASQAPESGWASKDAMKTSTLFDKLGQAYTKSNSIAGEALGKLRAMQPPPVAKELHDIVCAYFTTIAESASTAAEQFKYASSVFEAVEKVRRTEKDMNNILYGGFDLPREEYVTALDKILGSYGSSIEKLSRTKPPEGSLASHESIVEILRRLKKLYEESLDAVKKHDDKAFDSASEKVGTTQDELFKILDDSSKALTERMNAISKGMGERQEAINSLADKLGKELRIPPSENLPYFKPVQR